MLNGLTKNYESQIDSYERSVELLTKEIKRLEKIIQIMNHRKCSSAQAIAELSKEQNNEKES